MNNSMDKKEKKHLFTCEKCGQGTNNAVWIWGKSKTALCSKDYKKWLEAKGRHYKAGAVELWEDLTRFE